MKKTILIALAIMMAGASFNTVSAQSGTASGKVSLTTPNDTLSYVAGVALSNGLVPFLQQQFGVAETDLPTVIDGFRSAIAQRNDPKAKAFHAGEQIAEMVMGRMLPNLQKDFAIGTDSLDENKVFAGFIDAIQGDTTYYTVPAAEKLFQAQREAYKNRADSTNKRAGEEFLAQNRKKKGVVVLPSGLQYKVLVKGKGAVPKADDKVQVVYEGTTIDGKVFDATSRHGGAEFDTFVPNSLIKGWQEALTLMPVGSKWQLFIPYNLAYGEQGAGSAIKPYSALVFTMELKGIEKAEPKPENK